MWHTQMNGMAPIGAHLSYIQLVLEYIQASSIEELIVLFSLNIQLVLQKALYRNFAEFEFSQL